MAGSIFNIKKQNLPITTQGSNQRGILQNVLGSIFPPLGAYQAARDIATLPEYEPARRLGSWAGQILGRGTELVAQLSPPTMGGEQSGLAQVGRLLQRVPEEPFDLPTDVDTAPEEGTSEQILEFLLNLIPGAIHSYGKSFERVGTPSGRAEIGKGISELFKEPLSLQTLLNPAVQTALDVSDFLPGVGFVGLGAKQLGKRSLIEGGEKVARELAEETAERLSREIGQEIGEEAIERASRFAAGELTTETVERVGREEAERLARESAERFIREDLGILTRETGEVVETAAEQTARQAIEIPEQAAETAAREGAEFTFDQIPKQADDLSEAAARVGAEGTERVARETAETVGEQVAKKPQYTLDAFEISGEAKETLEGSLDVIRKDLQEAGETLPLTDEEILRRAEIAEPLRRATTREQQAAADARLVALRQNQAAIAEKVASGTASPDDFTELFREGFTALEEASARGRALRALQVPIDARQQTIVDEIIRSLHEKGFKLQDLEARLASVDFTKPKEVAKFYREFVKPTWGEVLGEFRYINLLSSPLTHIKNAFTNMVQVGGLSPTTRLVSGAVDAVASALTGKEREHFIREVPAYVRGAMNSIGEATQNAGKVLRGEMFVERPDVTYLSTAGAAPRGFLGSTVGKALSQYNELARPVLNALEASDIFFRTIAYKGELEALAKKATLQGKDLADPAVRAIMEKEAMDKAKYTIFRQALDPTGKLTGQGKFLQEVDKLTSTIYKARNDHIMVKLFVPFVQTPVNILKQGVEYSPIGLATAVGAKDPIEQVSKALLGTSVLAGAWYLASTTDSTWDIPQGKKQSSAFFASGRKPYSIKIGDTWLEYSQLGPLAYPIAMAAAHKHYMQQNPSSISDKQTVKIAKTLASVAQFFSDQSYVQGIGDLLKIAEDPYRGISESLSNIPRQMIPMTSLLGFVARIVDPIYRDPETPVDDILIALPFASTTVEPHTEPGGQPSVRPYSEDTLKFLLNAVSPLRLSPADTGRLEELWQSDQFKRRIEEINQSVKEGKISQEEARNLIQQVTGLRQQQRPSTGIDEVNDILRPAGGVGRSIFQ